MKIENIKTEKQLLKFLEKEYGSKKAIDRKKLKSHYTKSMGRQYYSVAQGKAILDGD